MGVIALALATYAWWATSLRPFTVPSLTAVLAAGVLAAAVGAALLPQRVRASPVPHRDVWVGLVAAVALWELVEFARHPRSEHPTISSLTNTLFANHPARTLGLLLWFALGAWLTRPTVPARPLAGRALAVAAFLWIGWHVFVRASY
jgi:hypothetical protein